MFAEMIGSIFGIVFLIAFLGAIFFGPAVICAVIAKKQGRSAAIGAVCGLMFSFLAVVVYMIAGDTTEQRIAKEDALRDKLAQR